MVKINQIKISNDKPLVLIAGPCVIENKELLDITCGTIKDICEDLKINFIFKSSYRKANRTSINSFSGLGNENALEMLSETGKKYNVPLITDIHLPEEAEMASKYVDILQIPAFLSRQTDILEAAGKTGKIVNIKKGQFLAPEDMKYAAEKIKSTGNNDVLLTERGSSFGYHNLVVDMRSFVIMKELGYPVIMDATHSVQIPSQTEISGGNPEFILPLSKAAVAIGIAGLFLEVHPEPEKAKSDAGSQLKLSNLKKLLQEVIKIDAVVKNY